MKVNKDMIAFAKRLAQPFVNMATAQSKVEDTAANEEITTPETKTLLQEMIVPEPSYILREESDNSLDESLQVLQLADPYSLDSFDNIVELNRYTSAAEEEGEEEEEENATLYCSACIKPFTVETFYSHIIQAHHAQPIALMSEERFHMPSLIPSFTDQPPRIKPMPFSAITSMKEAKKGGVLLPEIVPNKDDPNFYCAACIRYYPTRNAFKIHLLRVHLIISSASKTPLANPNLLPDVNNPDIYCITCNEYFTSDRSFRVHITYKHFLDTGIHAAGINRPKFPCQVCDAVFLREDYQQDHMLRGHNIKTLIDSDGGNDVNGEGSSSDGGNGHGFSEEPTSPDYDNAEPSTTVTPVHEETIFPKEPLVVMKQERRMTRSGLQSSTSNDSSHIGDFRYNKMIKRRHVVPDVNSRNNHCAACEKTYKSRTFYTRHLRVIHNMQVPENANGKKRRRRRDVVDNRPQKVHRTRSTVVPMKDDASTSTALVLVKQEINTSGIMPNVNDSNYYCGSCDRRFSFPGTFRNHLKRQHNFVKVIVPETIIVNHRVICNFLCQLCRMTFNKKEPYRDHLLQAHNKLLATPSRLQDFYCDFCPTSFKSIRKVLNHSCQKNIEGSSQRPMTPKKEIKVECEVCDRVFDGRYELGVHKEDEHRIHFIYDDETLHCNLCDSFSSDLQVYRAHLVDVHLIDQLPVENTLKAVKDKKINYLLHRRTFGQSNVKKTDYTTPDINDPSNKYCRMCDIEYNSTTHYQLHCFKFHEVNV